MKLNKKVNYYCRLEAKDIWDLVRKQLYEDGHSFSDLVPNTLQFSLPQSHREGGFGICLDVCWEGSEK